MRLSVPSVTLLAALSTLAAAPGSAGAQTAGATYWAYVGAESADLIHRIRLGPDGARVEKTIPVGELPVETEGPHGLRVSPDGRYLYMTTGHGLPDGKLWKFDIAADTLVARPIDLGFFPATLDLTPDGLYAFIVNFNLHGEKTPSTVSVVYTPTMMEIAQVETCIQPHGSRLDRTGDHMYSACVQDDEVVDIDTRSFEVARRFRVARGDEGPLVTNGTNGTRSRDGGGPTCAPTWAAPAPDADRLYVACNRGDVILEIATDTWALLRRIPSGHGPYNLAISPDGRRLIASLKQGGAVEVFELPSGRSLKVFTSSTTLTHGVAVSSDSRYAFVSAEGVGAAPGKLDIYDLTTLSRVAALDVGQQAGGVAFWKMTRGPSR